MRRLVIDTATPCLSLALFDGERLLAHVHETVGRGHAELLLPAIAGLPDGGRAQEIWVGCGPGSFTGIRIGIAAARALAFGWGARLQGFDTLALIAAEGRRLSGAAACAVAVDGGHGEWFVEEMPQTAHSASPDAAAAMVTLPFVAGVRAGDLVARRGFGTAVAADADARGIAGLSPQAMLDDARPLYGRAPDALPGMRA